ncbi:twin-arginine translocation signal domain-containing protein [Fulvivirga sp. M361]|uniref:twin-arginine translocation signal domain-containing protein n=1 Tax=Fulvivirga sp. M361 TaxID=2594266 RepID=UPI00117AE170|nr:twin-arginine translocation signal domain-containing protein [Fulvivirga sp. M361]TRX52062.1 twin-arginine translocation signal domain-containing protein [Fulvivirga sp. M361]
MGISRRDFVQKAAVGSAALGIAPQVASCASPGGRNSEKTLNAYYFRAHMYTLVPRQVKEDLKWMADIGTNVVSVAILEQDLRAAVENVEIIVNEANKLGMEVFAVPSRWAGLLAGAPKVPSVFTVQNPDTWMINEKGTFYKDRNVGTHSSIHYEQTFDFFTKAVNKIFKLWNIKGIIWDEPKIYDKKDFSEGARENIANLEDVSAHNEAFSGFFTRINAHIKRNYPDKVTNLFAYANWRKEVIDSMAGIKDLDYLGCDGRPWPVDAGGQVEQNGKNLLGGPGKMFLEAAHNKGKKGLLLIENHNMPAENNALMDKYLPEVVALQPEQLIYYYYPRNVDKPDDNMAIIAKHLKDFR